MARGHWSVLSSVLVALTLVRAISACVVTPIPVKVGSSFAVRVVDRRHPIAGMKVTLERYEPHAEETRSEAVIEVTDHDGKVSFFDLLPGEYYVSVERGGIGSSALVEVEPTRRAKQHALVDLEWPGKRVLQSKTLSGRFTAWLANTTDSRIYNLVHPLHGPLKAASLALTNGATGEVIWQGATDAFGRFAAPAVDPGLYVLEIRESEMSEPKSFFRIADAIPVEVSSNASEDGLFAELSMSDCGLMYTGGCQEVHLTVTQACGVVVDSLGAAVGRADVLLYGIGTTQRMKVLSSEDGGFNLQNVPRGEYRLLVGRPGFSSANISLTLHGAPESTGCEKPIAVQLHTAGECSTASVEPR